MLAEDALEHLAPLGRVNGQLNIISVLKEVYRVLKPGGVALIKVPTTEGPGAFQDPTHITYWTENTFKYFDSRFPHQSLYDFDIDLRCEGTARTVSADGVVWCRATLRAMK